ncbi:hypothetical protein [Saccharopolyspora sp. NPDC002376]
MIMPERLGSPSDVAEMLEWRPETTAMSVPDTTHELHLEQPEVLHNVLAHFLEASA